MRVVDKVFVVTGGGDGIGRALALALLSRGARVAAVDISADGLDETAKLADAGNRLATLRADVTDRRAVRGLPELVLAAHGSIDGLINNAGIIQPFVRVNDLDYDTIDRVISVNLYGQIHMVKEFLPHLLERPEAQIANVSSMGGFIPVPGQSVYGASKAAVKLLTEGLYAELLETNVRVSVIMPGAVLTNITDNSGVAAPEMAPEDVEKAASRAVTPQRAAEIILAGIEDNRLHIYVGRDSRTMNLANRLAPRRSTHLIAKQMRDLLS